jgi:hypothetical protein
VNEGQSGAARRSSAGASRADLILSALLVELEQEQFYASIMPYLDEEAFTKMRGRPDVFVYRRARVPPQEQVLVVPLGEEHVDGLTDATAFTCKQQLRVVAALIQQRLPELVPQLELRRASFGLERVRATDDLVDAAFRRAGLQRPPKLGLFHKHHRTVLRVRHEFMPGRGSFLAMTVEFRREFEIDGTARDLQRQGLDLSGTGLLGLDGTKPWLGSVIGVEGDRLVVTGEHGPTVVDPDRCRVDPTIGAFSIFFSQALSPRDRARYDAVEWSLSAEQLSGDGYVARLGEVAGYFGRLGSLRVARGLSFHFGEILSASFWGREPGAVALPPTEYCFSADRTAIDTLPFRGLDLYGPFDGRRFEKKEPRILVVCPHDARDDTDHFLRRFLEGMAKDGKQRFARGFTATYRLTKTIPQFVTVSLPKPGSSQVGDRYLSALTEAFDPTRRPDLVLVIVRDEDAFIENGNPYLAAKAYLLSQGIPSQEVRLSKVRSGLGNLAYILEDIAVASYAKMGGCPWTLMPTLPLTKEVIIGMAYAEFGDRFASRKRYMGIATVFTSDGTYVLAASSPRCTFEEYPDKLAASVRDILARLVKDYGWGEGDIVRLVFHSSKQLTRRDMETVARVAVRELGANVQFETAFATIHREHPFKVVAPGSRGRKGLVELASGGFGFAQVGQCVPERGVIVDLGRSRRLVCVHGTILAKREGEGIPQPLLVELHPASTYKDIAAIARQVFHFTGLCWGSMKPVTEPVTIHYARLIAKMLARLDGHPAWSDGLLDTHLRTSRWFL